jgi:hypothetical protein
MCRRFQYIGTHSEDHVMKYVYLGVTQTELVFGQLDVIQDSFCRFFWLFGRRDAFNAQNFVSDLLENDIYRCRL